MSDGLGDETEQRPCDNPDCPKIAEFEVTIHYPRGDVTGYLCNYHSSHDVVTRERKLEAAPDRPEVA